ncbi:MULTISPECIES: TetR-like C-terminal domain-containing protein [Micromonospora]|uniref:HTH-type transcriptional regulator MT1864/Rv1816-like C-terminal domain-containing protein n=1 Tax=Micromonospora yangpuensis TaxID=683228 RepID=A0A1C6UK70_9ACTN|nr:TetR-like C-terminal domain-containing protein [Micromonospora yangpuensis]GGM16900.1 TetR family transcriptional regulator [Micromonospora yangpuensis]SCL54460.1 hypothetical protein GA0070617_2671 [Micromonospora yangpuensis]
MNGIQSQSVPDLIRQQAYARLALVGPEVLRPQDLAAAAGVPAEEVTSLHPDESTLFTALVIEAYQEMGAHAEGGAEQARAEQRGLLEQWVSTCRQVRIWAQANPEKYALIWGPPRPGYSAPPETMLVGARTAVILINLLRRAQEAGRLTERRDDDPQLSVGMLRNVENLGNGLLAGLPQPVIARMLVAWTQFLGMVSFAVYGHVQGFAEEPDEFFDYAATSMGRFVGLPAD